MKLLVILNLCRNETLFQMGKPLKKQHRYAAQPFKPQGLTRHVENTSQT